MSNPPANPELSRIYEPRYTSQKRRDVYNKLMERDVRGEPLPEAYRKEFRELAGEDYEAFGPLDMDPFEQPSPSPAYLSGQEMQAPPVEEVSDEGLAINDRFQRTMAKPKVREPMSMTDAVEQRFEELRVDDYPEVTSEKRRQSAPFVEKRRQAIEDDVDPRYMATAADLLFNARRTPAEPVEKPTPKTAERTSPKVVEPDNNEGDLDFPMEVLEKDFRKIMGGSFNPKSSVDQKKMTLLYEFKQAYPELSTNALALKIYRSGRL